MAPRPPLVLGPRWRRACVVLQLVPLPGVGAVLAGWKNPHTRLRTHGFLQAGLVLLGSWPLVVPGAAGLAWAVWDAAWIWRARPPGPLSGPAPGWHEPDDAEADPEAQTPAPEPSVPPTPPAAPTPRGGLRSREKRRAP